MNSTHRMESPWTSLPWYPESWNSSVELWILVVSWLPAALPGAGALLAGFGEVSRFGVLGSLPLLLSSHWIVPLEKVLWPWLNTPHSLPGEQHCQPHPWAGGHQPGVKDQAPSWGQRDTQAVWAALGRGDNGAGSCLVSGSVVRVTCGWSLKGHLWMVTCGWSLMDGHLWMVT